MCCKKTLKKRLGLKKYSILTVGDFDIGESWFCESEEQAKELAVDAEHNALSILGSILDEPDRARWPRSIRIGHLCNEDEAIHNQDRLEDDYRDKMQQAVTHHSAGLRELIAACVFIPECEKIDTFESLCKPTGEVVAARLLLTLLPNLQSIRFQSNSYRLEKLAETVEKIAIANRNQGSPHHGKALTQLCEISMDRADTEMGEDPHIYGPFAMLPSLKTIQGCKIDGASFDWPQSFRTHHALSSNVTKIDFRHSAVSSTAFAGLIGGIAALRDFGYHDVGAIVGDSTYDPAGIVEALRQHAAHSLVSLDIAADDVLDHDGEVDLYVGSLRMFQALETIRLEETSFQFNIRDPLDNDHALNDGQSHEDEDSEAEDVREESAWECLVNVLPASIKIFKLVQFSDADDIRGLFEGMGARKSELLTALKTIRFEHPEPLEPDMLKELKDAGIVLKSWNVTI